MSTIKFKSPLDFAQGPPTSVGQLAAKGWMSGAKAMQHELQFSDKEMSDLILVAKGKADIDDFPNMFESLYGYYMSEMPYGTAKARDGCPYEWISEKLWDELGGSTDITVYD